MNHCHSHNLVDPARAGTEKPWGIRVSVPATDPINRLIGSNWHREHWYATRRERDTAFANMQKRHGFYRIGDEPSQVLTRIDPPVA